jgi:hypothetical protein
MAGREYAVGEKKWWKLGAAALGFLVPGAAILALSV